MNKILNTNNIDEIINYINNNSIKKYYTNIKKDRLKVESNSKSYQLEYLIEREVKYKVGAQTRRAESRYLVVEAVGQLEYDQPHRATGNYKMQKS